MKLPGHAGAFENERYFASMKAVLKSVIGAAALSALAVVAIPGTAHADSANFQFCNRSSVMEQVQFPYHGRFGSYVTNPGGCWTADLQGQSSDEAVVYQYINGYWEAMYTQYFDDASPWTEVDY
jgi:hypothetical protein